MAYSPWRPTAIAPVDPASVPRGRVDNLPVVLHANDCPAVLERFVPADVELLHLVLAVVSVLARAIVMVHEEREARARAGHGPLQHLQLAVRFAEGSDRPPADAALDADRFALLVVHQVDLGLFDEHRFAVTHL